MPQPLSRVKKLSSGSRGGPTIITQRPELALQVLSIITTWSRTEAHLGRIMAACLQLDSAIAMSMYASLSSAEARRAVLEAAVRQVATESQVFLFQVLMRALKPIRKRRNELAHGLWKISDDLPDALIWESPDDHNSDFATFLRMNHPTFQKRHSESAATWSGSEPMVYRMTDLNADLDDATDGCLAAGMFAMLMNQQFSETHADSLARLLGSPLLQRYGVSQYRQNTP